MAKRDIGKIASLKNRQKTVEHIYNGEASDFLIQGKQATSSSSLNRGTAALQITLSL